MNVIFWGGGQFWNDNLEKIKEINNFSDDYWLCIMDNDASKWNREYIGLMICQPVKVDEAVYVITSKYIKEIRQELIERFHVKTDKIMSFGEYARAIYAKKIYERKYTEKSKCGHPFSEKKIIVYTGITGGYDLLHDPVAFDQDIEYICFTNDKTLHSNIWNIQHIENHNLDDIHLARYIKLFPHIFFKEYEVSIWVDGKYQISGDLREYLRYYEKAKSMLCFPHPERDCIYEEAEECKRIKKCVIEDVDKQIRQYKKEKYPAHNGLYETGCIMRAHNDMQIQRIMEGWWAEIEQYCYRDQISLPYIFWKNKYLPDICDLDINHNKWLEMVRGERERK